MFCTNCGKKIPEESKFCPFCGTKLSDESESARIEEKQEEDKKNQGIWDKFVEIYTSKGEERKKYVNLSSQELWELIDRLGINPFEKFIQENKDVLNKEPYKVIEDIKSAFSSSSLAGYWFCMAETFLVKGTLSKLKTIDLNKFIEEWKKTLDDEIKKPVEERIANDELLTAMVRFCNFEMDNIFKTSPSLKELTHEFIEKLKNTLLLQIFYGYLAGLTESKYRE